MRARVRIALLVSACCGAGPVAAQWTHHAGDAARSASAATPTPPLAHVRWAAQPEPDEEFVPFATPVADFAQVYVAARWFEDGLHVANALIAFDAHTGARRWATPLVPDASDSWSSAAIDLNRQYVYIGSDREFYALHCDSGAPVWHATLARPVVNASPAITFGLTNSGTPANRVLISDFNALGGATLYAFNIDPFAAGNPFAPGDLAWSAALPGASGNSPAVASDVVVCASTSGRVLSFNARTGAPRWNVAAVNGQGFFGGVAIRADAAYAATYNFSGGQNNSRLVKLDLATGALRWMTTCERTDAIPVVREDGMILLSGGIDGFGSVPKVQAFLDTGSNASLVWDTYSATSGTLVVGGWTNQPLLSGNTLLVGAPDPAGDYLPNLRLVALRLGKSPSDPRFVGGTFAGAGGSAASALDQVYSLGSDGLFCLGLPDGAQQWSGAPVAPP